MLTRNHYYCYLLSSLYLHLFSSFFIIFSSSFSIRISYSTFLSSFKFIQQTWLDVCKSTKSENLVKKRENKKNFLLNFSLPASFKNDHFPCFIVFLMIMKMMKRVGNEGKRKEKKVENSLPFITPTVNSNS